MKVLLLSPPQKEKIFPSLGIAYIASVLNKNNHEAFLVDGANSSVKEIMDFIEKIRPEIVGISINTTNRFDGLNLSELIKKKYKLSIILGGPHATLLPDQLLKNYPFVDYIIRNEGEYSVLALVNALEKKESIKNIKGISYRQNNEVVHNPPSEFIQNLDELPFPDWKFFDLKRYAKENEYPEECRDYPHGSIISSRGCPYRCTFCSSSNLCGHKIRFRSAENVLKEVNMLHSMGIKFFVYNDDNFTSDKERAIKICRLMIGEGLHKEMSWLCRSEVNAINEELLGWMKKANCYMIEFGIEDCSEEGLKWFKKSHRKEQVKDAFDLCRKYGIKTRSYFIVGGDHETKANLQQKKRYIEELNPFTTTASILLAYPGTEVYETGKKKGLWDDSVWLTKCNGKKFHNYAPIYTGPNLTYSELFSASADILYWWEKKNGHYTLKENLKRALDMIKNGDLTKVFSMGITIIKQKVR